LTKKFAPPGFSALPHSKIPSHQLKHSLVFPKIPLKMA
jgi:hypothetical protein